MKTKPCLTLDDCRRITAAAEAEAKKHNWNVTLVTAEIAVTKVSEDRIAAGRIALLRAPVLPVQGGVPIMVQGECVGAVGVSGVQSQEDEQVCNAGIAAIA